MSDRFEVVAQSAEILDSSHLAEEMKHAARHMTAIPVLIGKNNSYFHEIDGGYHRGDGYHVIDLIHTVHGPTTPPSETYAKNIEVHLDGVYVYLTVDETREFGDYPDEDYTLSLKVTDYQTGPYSFSEELRYDIDKRETRYEWSDE